MTELLPCAICGVRPSEPNSQFCSQSCFDIAKQRQSTRPPIGTDEVVELRQKLRMIISHASGGALSKPKDIDRSVNDICVEISRHKNAIWEHAQESAIAAMKDAAP